jgi:putative transposase
LKRLVGIEPTFIPRFKPWDMQVSCNFIFNKSQTISHSYSKIWIHAIWATKKRQPIILPKIEDQVYRFINREFTDAGCPVKIINGMPDHIHCLFLLNRNKSISDIIKQVKESSAHYINDQNLTSGRFAWQTGYAAYSVSESVLEKTYSYIQNQKAHHAQKTFEQEYAELLKLHALEK